MIGASLLVATLFLGAFLWAIKSNQYDDDYSPSVRMLFDDKPKVETKSKSKSKTIINKK